MGDYLSPTIDTANHFFRDKEGENAKKLIIVRHLINYQDELHL